MPTRKTVLQHLVMGTAASIVLLYSDSPMMGQASAFPVGGNKFMYTQQHSDEGFLRTAETTKTAGAPPVPIAYRSMIMDVSGTQIPVALWYPITSVTSPANAPPASSAPPPANTASVTYSHQISVRRIGQLLAGWDFIPSFASKQFALKSSYSTPLDGTDVPLPARGPVVILAHGYLGSRFDLSHLAEALAQKGFICVSAEYPESLAASYERRIDLDRSPITTQLLLDMKSKWGIEPTAYGIVGHSLGTGTALSTGDATWARVCIAGFPRPGSGNVLYISSMNDGTASFSRFGGKDSIPRDFAILDEATAAAIIATTTEKARFPSRATVLFDRPDGPNHISFLTDEVNEAMIDLLSPLLPVAQALKIPVLDFDKYKVSRDSQETAAIVIPLVTKYLKQEMKV